MRWLSRMRSPTNQRSLVNIPTIISFGLAFLFLLFLVSRFDVDLGSTWQRLKDSNLLLFALAIPVHYSTFIFRGARWRLLLTNVEDDHRSPTTTLYCGRLILVAWFINSITWFRLGDAYRGYAYASEASQSFPRTLGTILAERVLDAGSIFILMSLGALLLIIGGTDASWLFVVLAAVLVGVSAGVLTAMWLFRRRLAHRLPGKLREGYYLLHHGALGGYHRPHLLAALSLLAWMAEVGRLFLVSQAVGVEISFGLVVFVTVANSLLTLIPFTPGGLGLVEAGVVGLLMVTLEKSQAVPVALLDRSISYLSIIVTGGLLFVGTQIIRRRSQRSSAMAAER